MTKIVVIAKCKDQANWEAGYGMSEDDYVGACFETGDLAKAMSAISSP